MVSSGRWVSGPCSALSFLGRESVTSDHEVPPRTTLGVSQVPPQVSCKMRLLHILVCNDNDSKA